MTFADFKTLVRVYLPIHSRREGIQTLIDQYIKAGLIDLQRAVPTLRENHVSVYTPAYFTTDGFTGRAVYPVGAAISHAAARNPADRSQIFEFRFANTQAEKDNMVQGLVPADQRWISLDAPAGILRVTPNPKQDGSEVVLVWSGTKIDFEATDETPFDEATAEAISEFVLARLARTVDDDLAAAQSYNATYVRLKRALFTQANHTSYVVGRDK